jgi:hypothetical protein
LGFPKNRFSERFWTKLAAPSAHRCQTTLKRQPGKMGRRVVNTQGVSTPWLARRWLSLSLDVLRPEPCVQGVIGSFGSAASIFDQMSASTVTLVYHSVMHLCLVMGCMQLS